MLVVDDFGDVASLLDDEYRVDVDHILVQECVL